METLDLGGAWSVRNGNTGAEHPATVPGCIHTDLLASGRIDAPFFRDNEKHLQWIGETDWIYTRTFDVPADLPTHDCVRLVCEGLDTLATIRLNGNTLACTDNMFRRYAFDVGAILRPGSNTLEIRFDSVLPYIRSRQGEGKPMFSWNENPVAAPMVGDGAGAAWVRKQPCNFGWDWGPRFVTCGIWRPIRLEAFDTARLEDVHIRQTHAGKCVTLSVAARAESLRRAPLRAAVTVTLAGKVVAESEAVLRRNACTLELSIPKPALWWPLGMGAQPLYEVTIDLLGEADGLLDTVTKRIGLRTLRLVRKPDAWGESFHFEANGIPFFAKGSNYIPCNPWPVTDTGEYAYILQSAAATHQNMIRVWGGGIYEDARFYDLCDELGLTVWQDFMFACSTYPAFDKAWMENVRLEAVDNVRRLRHHACIALWVGNNELEQGLVGATRDERHMSWTDYRALFDRLLPGVLRKEDPDRDYWPCSPHTPAGDRTDFNNPHSGDAHLWGCWFSNQPFEAYRTCEHRFNSEFGFQSFPAPRTVAEYTHPDERNITHPIMEWHQRSSPGNGRIAAAMTEWFRFPKDQDSLLWLSQIQQGMAIKYGVEHWRRSMPRGMGTLYWQLNDNWPVASWSGIDGAGRWKALHYMARDFYAPVLVSGIEDPARGSIEVHVTNDRRTPLRGTLSWSVTTTGGEPLAEASMGISVKAGTSKAVKRIDCRRLLGDYGAGALLVWLVVKDGAGVVGRNLVTFAKPKRMHLPDPGLRTTLRAGEAGTLRVSVSAECPALWVWLELTGTDAAYSDNFFHLDPGGTREVTLTPCVPLTVAQAKRELLVRSLVDTY